VVESPQVNPGAIVEIARLYASIGNLAKLEGTLEKLVQVAPTSPEAWYDLGGLKVQLHKNQEALPAIAKAIELSAERLAKDPKQSNLLTTIQKDPKFDPIRTLPEFQHLFSPK
jgi:hypothetical protein